MEGLLCQAVEYCEGLNPSAYTCAQAGVGLLTPCTNDRTRHVEVGGQRFNPSAGQACLASFQSVTACDSQNLFNVKQACASDVLFSGQSAVGGVCLGDGDCAPVPLPDGGTYRGRCAIDGRDPTLLCTGACVPPLQPGDDCTFGGDCVVGTCDYDARPDGGFAFVCGTQLDLGDACDPSTNYPACDYHSAYCTTDAGPSTCQPKLPLGAACSVAEDAVLFIYDSPCPDRAYCATRDGGDEGTCQPRFTVPTVLPDNPTSRHACDNSYVYADLPDGGDAIICQGPQPQLGGLCAFECGPGMVCNNHTQRCVLPGNLGDVCPGDYDACGFGLICLNGTCAPLPGLGDPCVGQCLAPYECDLTRYTCVPRQALGAPCSAANPYCADGYCADDADGGHVCAPRAAIGEPCEYTALGDSNCVETAYCQNNPAGGHYCEASLCAD